MKKILLIFILLLILCTYPNVQLANAESVKDEIIYDILVDRFNNGDQHNSEQLNLDDPYGYHGGDFKGIIMKLDDIKALGYTTISLSPVMENAKDGYHGYWTTDFYAIEKEFGKMEEFKQLVHEAHQRDLKVLLEFSPNYIAKTSSIASDNQDWIDQSKRIDTVKAPWLENVVMLNQNNPEVQTYLLSAADYWIEETGIDGYKLYAADQTSPKFLQTLTAHLKKQRPDFILAATLLQNNHQTVLDDPNIDLVENNKLSEIMSAVFSKENEPVSSIYETWQKEDNKAGLLYIDNKFTKRFTQKFAENGRNMVTAWKLALTYLYTAPGVPIVYQGSEIPMYGGEFPENQRLVEFNSGDNELKEFMERITSLHTKFPALKYGDFEFVASDQGMSVFKRSYQDETIYIAINNDTEARTVLIDEIGTGLQLRGLLGDNLVRGNKAGTFPISIPRETAEVYTVEEAKGLNWLFIGPIVGIFLLFVIAVVYLSKKQKKR